MQVSIVVSVYNSHGVLARQMKHFKRMNLPDDVEIIIADDGSNPPFDIKDYDVPNLRILPTGNTLAWTQGIGRNLGAQHAQGEYLLMTDIDHILSREAIEDVRQFTGDRMMFKRFFGILDEDGVLHQDLETLREYGLDVDNLSPKRGLYASVHMNTFGIKKSTFDALGGYDPVHSLVGFHPISRKGDDCYFNAKWNHRAAKAGIELVMGSPIYMFPIGRYHIRGETNPMGLFHNLSYDGQKRMNKGEEAE
jgi:glycosyltransferase involved in cell wall biosynthesis